MKLLLYYLMLKFVALNELISTIDSNMEYTYTYNKLSQDMYLLKWMLMWTH